MSFAVVTSKNKHCGYKSVYFSGLFTWLQVAASGLVWLRSTCLLILEQPLLGTCYSWRRGKRVLAETQWPKLLLEWAIRCIHTRAAGQCYSCKVNISGMDSHSLGDNESHTALSRDVKLRKGGANAQEQSHHRHTERDTASASNSTWSLVSTQQVLAIIILANREHQTLPAFSLFFLFFFTPPPPLHRISFSISCLSPSSPPTLFTLATHSPLFPDFCSLLFKIHLSSSTSLHLSSTHLWAFCSWPSCF